VASDRESRVRQEDMGDLSGQANRQRELGACLIHVFGVLSAS
jgi:hypothetical protein